MIIECHADGRTLQLSEYAMSIISYDPVKCALLSPSFEIQPRCSYMHNADPWIQLYMCAGVQQWELH